MNCSECNALAPSSHSTYGCSNCGATMDLADAATLKWAEKMVGDQREVILSMQRAAAMSEDVRQRLAAIDARVQDMSRRRMILMFCEVMVIVALVSWAILT